MASPRLWKDPLLLGLIVLASTIHLWALDWGTTNRERSLLVFSSEERIAELTPIMIESRQRIYAYTESGDADRPSILRMEEKPPVEHFPSTAGEAPEELRPGMVDSLRSYLLRSGDPDEQRTLSAVGNMNPAQGDFNPDDLFYGGAYIYTVAGFLAFGMVSGMLTVTSNLSHYFQHPEHMGAIFAVCRLVGSLAIVATSVVLYLWGALRWNRATGFWAGLLFVTAPLIITYGNISKPNCFGTFWMILAFYLYDRLIVSPSVGTPTWKPLLAIGSILGIAIGGFMVCGIGLVFLSGWIVFHSRFRLLPALQQTAWVVLGSAIGFLVTNPYIPFSITDFFDMSNELLDQSQGWGYSLPSFTKVSIVLATFPSELGYLTFWGMVAGCVIVWKQSKAICSLAIVLTLFLGLFLGFTRFLIPMVPLLCLFAAVGILCIASVIPSKPVRNGLAVVLCLVLMIQTVQVLAAMSYDTWMRNQSGEWINETIPKGATIGLPYQKPLIWRTPPFSFEQYNLTVFYETTAERFVQHQPEWIIVQDIEPRVWLQTTAAPSYIPDDSYRLEHTIAPPSLLGILPLFTPGYEYHCQPVMIWRLNNPS